MAATQDFPATKRWPCTPIKAASYNWYHIFNNIYQHLSTSNHFLGSIIYKSVLVSPLQLLFCCCGYIVFSQTKLVVHDNIASQNTQMSHLFRITWLLAKLALTGLSAQGSVFVRFLNSEGISALFFPQYPREHSHLRSVHWSKRHLN